MRIAEGQPYIIAETAFHHEGDRAFMDELIATVSRLRVQAIKFHLLLDIDRYFTRNHPAYEKVRSWLFSENEWKQIISGSTATGLDLILLCNDLRSIDFVIENFPTATAIEIHATGLNDHFLLQGVTQFHGTIILGVGGSTIDEIDYAVGYLKSKGCFDIVLMYGFQNYPTNYSDVNLLKIRRLHDLFGLRIGYADHTDPADPNNEIVSVLAAAMGFNILEKHVTHRANEKNRADAQAAVSIEQMNRIQQLMGLVLQVRGSGNIEMTDAERSYGDVGPMKKAIVAAQLIKQGEKLTISNMSFMRTQQSSYVRQRQFLELIGLEALSDIQPNEVITFDKVKYQFKKPDLPRFGIR